jgi:uncharacterized caspase-like protein
MAKHALCIGINDYPGTDSDLADCVNDAHDWASVLTKRGFSVKKMLNQQATTKQMRSAIESLVLDAKKGDRVVIQYSGHGSFLPDLDVGARRNRRMPLPLRCPNQRPDHG